MHRASVHLRVDVCEHPQGVRQLVDVVGDRLDGFLRASGRLTSSGYRLLAQLRDLPGRRPCEGFARLLDPLRAARECICSGAEILRADG